MAPVVSCLPFFGWLERVAAILWLAVSLATILWLYDPPDLGKIFVALRLI